MKKVFKRLLPLFCVIAMVIAVAGCGGKYGEVAGTYELKSISGTISGVTVDESYYEYFRMILNANGDGTVQSKGTAAGSVAYEAKGTCVYEDGVIKFTTRSGAASTTEEYLYEDGVITYKVDMPQMEFTLVLERVQ